MKLSNVEQIEFLKKLGIDPELPPRDILRLVREARGRLDAIAVSRVEEFISEVELLRGDMLRTSREIRAKAGDV